MRDVAEPMLGLGILVVAGAGLPAVQRDRLPPVRVRRQCPDDAAGQQRQIAIVLDFQQPAHQCDGLVARERPIALDGLEQIDGFLDAVAKLGDVGLAGCGFRQGQGIMLEPVPSIGP